jgi:hypothetical protein
MNNTSDTVPRSVRGIHEDLTITFGVNALIAWVYALVIAAGFAITDVAGMAASWVPGTAGWHNRRFDNKVSALAAQVDDACAAVDVDTEIRTRRAAMSYASPGTHVTRTTDDAKITATTDADGGVTLAYAGLHQDTALTSDGVQTVAWAGRQSVAVLSGELGDLEAVVRAAAQPDARATVQLHLRVDDDGQPVLQTMTVKVAAHAGQTATEADVHFA